MVGDSCESPHLNLQRVDVDLFGRGHGFPTHSLANRASLGNGHAQSIGNVLSLESFTCETLGKLLTQSDVCKTLGVVSLTLTLTRTDFNHVLNLCTNFVRQLTVQSSAQSLNLSHLNLLSHFFLPFRGFPHFLGSPFAFPFWHLPWYSFSVMVSRTFFGFTVSSQSADIPCGRLWAFLCFPFPSWQLVYYSISKLNASIILSCYFHVTFPP